MKKSIGSGRGSVYNILLKALQTGDKYGYEICKEIEEKSNGAYILKQPSLYSGLKRLEAQNLITSYWRDSDLGGRRHYYSLTDAGRQKIETSDFSWEDTRDNLVNSLFEKSAIENDIDDVVKQVDELKQQAENSNQLQNDIDDVISSTQSLANEHEVKTEEYSHIEAEEVNQNEDLPQENSQGDLFSYGNSDDLFSMFGNFQSNQQELESDIDEHNIHEEIKDTLSPLNDKINAFEEDNAEFDNTESIHDDQQAKENSYNESDEYIEEIEELHDTNQPTYEEKPIENNNEKKQEDFVNGFYSEDSNQLDLFSFANNQQKYEEQQEETIDEQEVDTYDDIIKNFTTYNSADTEENYDVLNGKDDFDNNQEENIDEQTENTESYIKENISENKEQDLFDFDNLSQKENFEQSLTDNLTDNKDDILNNSKNDLIGNEIEENNVIEGLEEPDRQDFEYYRNNRINSSSFADNLKQETVEKSFFNESFDESSFELENTDFNFSTLRDQEIEKEEINKTFEQNNLQEFDNINQNNTDKQSVIADLQKEEIQTESTENSDSNGTENSIDYVNIFGDLMTSNSTQIDNNQTDLKNEQILDSETQNESETTQTEKTSTYQDDLPRVTLNHNNINRTLTVDQEMMQEINEHYYEENPFEKLDGKIKEEIQEQNAFEQFDNQQHDNQQYVQQPSKNLPFDKKYDNVFNKFEVPDYQVRYYKKPTTENTKTTKFISINKLNLVSNIIMCILICLLTTTMLVYCSINIDLNSTQIAYFVLSYVVAIGITSFHFLKYMANKTKKSLELNKNGLIYNSFFAVVVVILTVAINILFGMNLTNILNYSATFILPLGYAVLLFMQPLLKKFLSKFSSFYLN